MQRLIPKARNSCLRVQTRPCLDAGLICAAQKVEHYEIAAYGPLVAWAKRLEDASVVGLLEATLREEESRDETLTEIAESINLEAEDADEDEE